MQKDKETADRSIPPTPNQFGGGTEPSILERFKRAKETLAHADSFYRSECFWKAFEEGGIDEFQVAKLEAMAKVYRDGKPENHPTASVCDDPIDRLLDRYDLGEIETVQDLADEAETLAKETGNRSLMHVVKGFRKWQKEDWELAGRRDSDEAENALIAGMKRASPLRDLEGEI